MRDPSPLGPAPNGSVEADNGPARDALERLRRLGGDQLAHDLVLVYLDQSSERIRVARDAIERGDAPVVADVAHALKSSSAQLGATALAAACEAAETAAEAGDLVGSRQWFDAVESRYAAFSAWLTAQAGAEPTSEQRSNVQTGPLIAVVEDNADNRLLVDAILGDRFMLDEYATGGDALTGMHERRPDLVLLDVSLPGMDGIEVLARIRREPRLRNVPVVALTAHAMAGDRERYLAAGFDDYFAKPIIDEDALVRVVERLIVARAFSGGGES